MAVPSDPVDGRSPRVAETEQPRTLVESLARGVVEGRPEPLGPARLRDREENRVPTAREQAGERRLECVRLEIERRDVPLEVVDRGEREAASPDEALRCRDADEERAYEAGALGDRDPIDGVERHARVVERRAHDGRDELQMAP